MPLQTILLLDVVTFAFAIAPLLYFDVPQPGRSADDATLLADLREGVRFLFGWRGMFFLLVFGQLGNVFANGGLTVLPILVVDHFDGGAPQLAMLEASFPLGIVLGGLIMTAWGGFKRRIVTMVLGWSLAGVAFGVVGVVAQHQLAVGVVAMLAFGLLVTLPNVVLLAMAQEKVPPAMQGRFFGVVNAVSQVGTVVGLALVGPFADQVGPQPWFRIGALVIVAVSLNAVLFKPIREVDAYQPR